VDLVRCGEALRVLFDTLTPIPHLNLLRAVTSMEVGVQPLMASQLAFPVRHYRRDSGVRAEVLMLGEGCPRKFKGDHLVPVQDLLCSEIVQLRQRAKEEIRPLHRRRPRGPTARCP
jgi:hypothetical protein